VSALPQLHVIGEFARAGAESFPFWLVIGAASVCGNQYRCGITRPTHSPCVVVLCRQHSM